MEFARMANSFQKEIGGETLGKYVLKRVLNIIPTLIIVAVVVFFITRVFVPGDPATTLLGPQATADQIRDMRIEMGLDQPLLKQFWDYFTDLLHGNLGYSYAYARNVTDLILERFPHTILLSMSALFIAIIIGIPAGILSACRRNKLSDYIVMVISLVGVSMPIFWMGVMLVLIFSVNLGILPATGMATWSQGAGEFFSHLVLPSVALSTIPMANFARITRSSMLEVLSQDYIRTVRAKGLKEKAVIWKHALKNAMIPILSTLGMQVASLLGGSVLTETIFSWPGMGRLITDAIDRRDLGVIQGVVIFVAIIYVVINLLVDILYTVVNPKIRYSMKGGK